MISVTTDFLAKPRFPSVQSELEENSLYRDVDGDIWLVGGDKKLVGYFNTRVGSDPMFVSRTHSRGDDISFRRLERISATISFT